MSEKTRPHPRASYQAAWLRKDLAEQGVELTPQEAQYVVDMADGGVTILLNGGYCGSCGQQNTRVIVAGTLALCVGCWQDEARDP